MSLPAILFAVAPFLTFPPVDAEPKESSKEDLCPFLRTEQVVSFKQQELSLFQRIVELVENSPIRPPTNDHVIETFAACWVRHREWSEPVASPDWSIRATAGDTGSTLSILNHSSGEEISTKIKHRANLPRLADRSMRSAIDWIDPSQQSVYKNLLWFLWIESYLRALGQRFNHYDYASDLTEARAEDRGRSFTVGFEMEMKDHLARVTGIRDERLRTAGLAMGDEIIRLNEKNLNQIPWPDLQTFWFNPRPFSFSVTARRLEEIFLVAGDSILSIHTTVAWSQRDSLSYVRIREFNRRTLIEFRRALRGMDAKTVNRLVIDVRNNPGGTLLPSLIDLFFKPGQTVVSYRDHDGSDAVDLNATVEYWGLPTAVLVDRNTASMAETFAAAFLTHERGPVVGEATVGKGVGQTLHPVLDEGRLHLVERTYFHPGTRESWNGTGLTPTLAVAVGEEETARIYELIESHVLNLDEQWNVDPVLRAADRLLKEMP